MPAHPVALLLVDVVSAFDFDGAEKLLPHARAATRPLADLAARARDGDVPVIYANDNFSNWTEGFETLVARCVRPEAPGHDIVRALRPLPGDYVVLKPRHSAFFQTPLETLLAHLGVETLVVGGFATDICVLATAIDATMRDIRLVLPQDASAAETEAAHGATLVHARRVLRAETPPASAVTFDETA